MYPDWTRAQRLFAEQFEPDGGGYVYRRSRKGEAIRVTRAERDHFVNAFVESQLRGLWIIFAGAGLLMMGLVFLAKSHPEISFSSIPSLAVICAAAFVLSIPYGAYLKWRWAAPARELRGRTPIAAKRTREEMRQLRLTKLTWTRLGVGALVAIVIAIPDPPRERRYPGWNHFALTVAIVLLALISVQAFRKWRFDRQNDDG